MKDCNTEVGLGRTNPFSKESQLHDRTTTKELVWPPPAAVREDPKLRGYPRSTGCFPVNTNGASHCLELKQMPAHPTWKAIQSTERGLGELSTHRGWKHLYSVCRKLCTAGSFPYFGDTAGTSLRGRAIRKAEKAASIGGCGCGLQADCSTPRKIESIAAVVSQGLLLTPRNLWAANCVFSTR